MIKNGWKFFITRKRMEKIALNYETLDGIKYPTIIGEYEF